MNDKKIAFIYCVNNHALYEESVRYVKSLHVPEGYEIEVIAIEGASSITSGYNQGMRQTDAKYKVYLHQDVFIVNKNFLYDIIALFEKYPKLGMSGVVGAKTIPRNGIWWESTQRFGKVYDSHTGEMKLLSFKETELEYEPVQAINGLIMITQYDIPWREDLFTGWHFYDLSECQEFLLAGYDVGVVRQDEPWCVHDCGIRNLRNVVDGDRKTFNQVYGQNVNKLNRKFLPLVSILIPTYNRPHYFELALQSALNQTYENIEVIVCDDSTNDETEKLIKKYTAKYNNLTYIKNPTRLGQFENDIKLFNLANGEYINYLMDDDLFHPQKIEKMMSYFIDDVNKEIKLVTSNRKMIDQNGEQLPDNILTQPLFEEDKVISGTDLGNLVLKYNFNCIGEPTTVLFRKSDLKEPFGTFLGRKYGCNVDIATWLTLLAEGKAVYVSQPLSYFRIHNSQQLQSTKMLLDGALDYAHEVLYARKKGFLEKKEDYLIALNSCEKYLSKVIEKLKNEANKDNDKFEELLSVYKELILEIETVGKQSNNNIVVNENYPLVSVLIPAYNRPYYLELALQSALNQTYPNIEIIISDDSTNDEVEKMLEPYLNKYNNIRYYRNNPPLVEGNFDRCFQLARGEYINYLMDDDIFHPEKIEKMIKYFLTYKDVTLVTSYRKLIDQNGYELPDLPTTEKLFNEDTIVDGKVLGNYMLKNNINIVGEPTTVLFRKQDLSETFGHLHGRRVPMLNDLTSWIALLAKGKAVYISEPLSYFRQHPGQNQKSLKYAKNAINDWIYLIMHSRKKGFLSLEYDYKTALNNVLKTINYIFQLYINESKTDLINYKELQSQFEILIKEIITHQDKYHCNYCNKRFERFEPWPDIYDFPNYVFENYNKYTAICPSCRSMDRERLYKLYIEKETNLQHSHSKVLHVAPETQLRKWLQSFENITYVCGDLYPSDDLMEKIDITDIKNYSDGSFDVIICSHVLEHIPDDLRAMTELYRVLKKGGWGIIQVPALNLKETFEDPSITTPEERLRVFGQADHVRIYAKDYVDRLKSVGFKVKEFNYAQKYGLSEAQKYGLSDTDVLYVVEK